ncbi:MAG: hypothetical protein CSA49_02370 [Gammaproteobacteria bacterium]|nr:MAG: hypothetical protein CSA49_02370 [Gammaproteobacteria bacterium]
MTVMLHPNKKNPERYRVFDRLLGVQEYFSISKLGPEKARRMAYERQKEIDRKRKMVELKAQLSINKLFLEDGSVKGLRRIKRVREGRKDAEYLSIQVTVSPGVQKHKEISLMNRDFDEAYLLAQNALLELHQIDRTPELSQAFKKARRLYW